MSDEPYRPGGEHCPKCGYRHDGRCNEKRQQFIKRCESFYAEKGFAMGAVAGWDARQPEIDALREENAALRFDIECNAERGRLREELRVLTADYDALRDFARDLWDYARVQWKGTRQYDVALAEARKLGIVEEASDER